MMTQPLHRLAFRLAERLGMTAYELMDRMTMPEMLDWIEYDQCTYDPSWEQWAMLYAKIDAAMGVKKPNAERYLPKVKGSDKRRPMMTRQETIANWMLHSKTIIKKEVNEVMSQ